MNKKLLVVAVAGALAVPTLALAQVSITGRVGFNIQSTTISSMSPARLAGANKSGFGVSDNGSDFVFNMSEDLGNGLKAYARVSGRPVIDSQSGAFAGSGGPAQWFGLESKTWGNVRVGTLTGLHFVTGPDAAALGGTAYNSVQGMQGGWANAGSTYAMTTRTRNAIAWDSINYGGFKMTVAYASNTAADGDIAAVGRKGRNWNLIPQYIAPNFNVGLSYYDNKPDAAVGTTLAAATLDEKGTRLYGAYKFGAFTLGGAWDKGKRKAATTGADVNDRTAYSIQGSWRSGPHYVGAAYAVARKDKIVQAAQAGVAAADFDKTGAKTFGVAYKYNLSKRTDAYVSYIKLTNDANAAYGAGTSHTPATGIGAGILPLGGEDFGSLMFGMNHSF